MPVWSETPIIYKTGIIGIVVSFVIFVVGFGTPVWFQTKSGSIITEYGLWQICQGETSMSNCDYFNFDYIIAYSVVRGVEIAACVFHLSSTLNALFKQTCQNTRPTWIAVSGILAGIIGLIGEVIFGTWGIAGQISSGQAGIQSNLSWSFALAVTGSGLVIIFSIMVVASSRATSYQGQVLAPSSGHNLQELPGHQPVPQHLQYQPAPQHLQYQPAPQQAEYLPQEQPQTQPHQQQQYYYGKDNWTQLPRCHLAPPSQNNNESQESHFYGGNQRNPEPYLNQYGYDQIY